MNNQLLTKGHAYIYLKTLMSLSGVFADKVKQLRQELNIEEPFKTDPTIYPTNWEELDAKKKYFDLSGNKEFQEFCEYFFLPANSWPAFAVYLYTNRKSQILDHSVHILTSNKDRLERLDKKFLVPYTLLYIPVDVSRRELEAKWKQISSNQQLANQFLQGVHVWRDGNIFDAALYGYRFKNTYPQSSKSEVENAIAKAEIIKSFKKASSVPTDILKYIRHVKKQILVLEGWYRMFF